MIVDRQYIFTLYQMGAGAVFRYLQQIEQRVEDAEARVTNSQRALVEHLSKELASTKRTLARKSQQLIRERQLNHQLQRRIRELERDVEHGGVTLERDSHNSSMPPSLDPPWKKVQRTPNGTHTRPSFFAPENFARECPTTVSEAAPCPSAPSWGGCARVVGPVGERSP